MAPTTVLAGAEGNALKFTKPNGVTTVGAKADKRAILFWVSDTGSGIARNELPHLFDRFWQGRAEARGLAYRSSKPSSKTTEAASGSRARRGKAVPSSSRCPGPNRSSARRRRLPPRTDRRRSARQATRHRSVRKPTGTTSAEPGMAAPAGVRCHTPPQPSERARALVSKVVAPSREAGACAEPGGDAGLAR